MTRRIVVLIVGLSMVPVTLLVVTAAIASQEDPRLTPRLRNVMPGVERRLERLGEREWVKILKEATESSEKGFRYPTLGKEDIEALAPPAIRAAKTWEEKTIAASYATRWQLRSALPEVLALLDDQDVEVRRRAAYALGDSGWPEAIPKLRRLLSEPDGLARSYACIALGKLGAKEAIPDIVRTLDHENVNARWRAVEALGHLGAEEEIPAIIKLLGDKSHYVRWNAAIALWDLKAVQAIPSLITLLDDEDGAVRWRAVQALGALRAKEAVPHLIKRLSDKGAGGIVGDYAAEALAEIGAEEAVPELIAMARRERSISAIEALGKLRAASGLPVIIEIIRSPVNYFSDDDPHYAAYEALQWMVTTESLPKVRPLAKHENNLVRAHVAKGLGRLATQEIIPDLYTLLGDSDPYTRGQAAKSLAKMKVTEALPRLINAVGGDGAVSEGVIDALEMLEAKEAQPVIEALLKHSKLEIRLRAASWLCHMGFPSGVPILLRESKDLSPLNALRTPELSMRLRMTSLKEPLGWTIQELAEKLAKTAAMELVLPERLTLEEISFLSRPAELDPCHEDRDTVLKGLRGWLGSRFHMVFEPGRIVLHKKEGGLQFWRSWWTERSQKEK